MGHIAVDIDYRLMNKFPMTHDHHWFDSSSTLNLHWSNITCRHQHRIQQAGGMNNTATLVLKWNEQRIKTK